MILDIGAGSGAYSIPLADEGYKVTAIELVKHNLRIIEKNSTKVKVIIYIFEARIGVKICLSTFYMETFI